MMIEGKTSDIVQTRFSLNACLQKLENGFAPSNKDLRLCGRIQHESKCVASKGVNMRHGRSSLLERIRHDHAVAVERVSGTRNNKDFWGTCRV
jgi:hypothetical protein